MLTRHEIRNFNNSKMAAMRTLGGRSNQKGFKRRVLQLKENAPMMSVAYDETWNTAKKDDNRRDVTTYSPVEVYRRFGRTYCFHIQTRKVIQENGSKQASAEHGSSTFLRNVGEGLPDYTAVHPRTSNPALIAVVEHTADPCTGRLATPHKWGRAFIESVLSS
jgi:hypothetical protein